MGEVDGAGDGDDDGEGEGIEATPVPLNTTICVPFGLLELMESWPPRKLNACGWNETV